jgi:transposase
LAGLRPPQVIGNQNLLNGFASQIKSLCLQIRNGLLAKYFPELDRLWGKRLQENLAILRWCLDPRKIAAMEFEAFMQQVTHRNTGAKQLRRLRAIWEVAAVSIGCPVTGAAVFEARQLADRLEDVRERIKQTEALMSEVAQRFGSYKRLLTIPGFGPYIASLVVATIGDADRFDNRKQVIRLAGLDLNAKRSGKRSQAAPSHISKRGNADLRYAIYQAALIASYHDERLRALFVRYLQGREKEQGIKTKMRVKLAAKLLVIAWTMMKNQTAFNPALIQV